MTSYEKYCNLRDSAGLTDAKVAQQIAVPRSTFSDWKAGRSKPGFNKMLKIAAFFQVSPKALLSDEEADDKPLFVLPYNVFESICNDNGFNVRTVAELAHIDGYDLLDWHSGNYYPNDTILENIAKVLHISLESIKSVAGESGDGTKKLVAVEQSQLDHVGHYIQHPEKDSLYKLADKVSDEQINEAIAALYKIMGEDTQ